MKKQLGSWLALCFLLAGVGFTGTSRAVAQDKENVTSSPPKLLYIVNEAIKPGKAGMAHEKTEAAFADAMADAKWPQHYIGMDALSGKSRALFFVGYDSFADWQRDMDATQKNATLTASLDRATAADGELLESIETSAYSYREDLSFRAPVKIEDMRYFEITIYNVRHGHVKEWDQLVKLYIKACDSMPNAHWALYEKSYGTESGVRFLVITPMKSLSEVDQEMKDFQGLEAAIGQDQMQKLRDLSASTIESEESHLFAINPKMSYVSADWVKADPRFWGKK